MSQKNKFAKVVGSASENLNLPPNVKRIGHLRKLKSMKKRFFVLYEESEHSVARLEYYISEKKWRTGNEPRKCIKLESCFNISRKLHSKQKFVIALYTREESFSIVMENDNELEEWLCDILQVQKSCSKTDGKWKPECEFVWQVVVDGNDLEFSHNISGPHHLALSSRALSLIKVGSSTEKSNILEFPLMSIRRCGHSGKHFFIEMGRSAITGAGGMWMATEATIVAQNIHETILSAMKSSRSTDSCCLHRPRSASTNENAKPVSARRPIGIVRPQSQLFQNNTLSNRERCDSLPTQHGTFNENVHSSVISSFSSPYSLSGVMTQRISSRPHSLYEWPSFVVNSGSDISYSSHSTSVDGTLTSEQSVTEIPEYLLMSPTNESKIVITEYVPMKKICDKRALSISLENNEKKQHEQISDEKGVKNQENESFAKKPNHSDDFVLHTVPSNDKTICSARSENAERNSVSNKWKIESSSKRELSLPKRAMHNKTQDEFSKEIVNSDKILNTSCLMNNFKREKLSNILHPSPLRSSKTETSSLELNSDMCQCEETAQCKASGIQVEKFEDKGCRVCKENKMACECTELLYKKSHETLTYGVFHCPNVVSDCLTYSTLLFKSEEKKAASKSNVNANSHIESEKHYTTSDSNHKDFMSIHNTDTKTKSDSRKMVSHIQPIEKMHNGYVNLEFGKLKDKDVNDDCITEVKFLPIRNNTFSTLSSYSNIQVGGIQNLANTEAGIPNVVSDKNPLFVQKKDFHNAAVNHDAAIKGTKTKNISNTLPAFRKQLSAPVVPTTLKVDILTPARKSSCPVTSSAFSASPVTKSTLNVSLTSALSVNTSSYSPVHSNISTICHTNDANSNSTIEIVDVQYENVCIPFKEPSNSKEVPMTEEKELNYASLDLMPSQRENACDFPVVTKVASTSTETLSYAEIDFAKSEGLKNTSNSLRRSRL